MRLAVAVLVAGLCGVGAAASLRIRAARIWSRALVAYRVHLPAGLSVDDIGRWLGMVAASTRTPWWPTHQPVSLGLELAADTQGIRHYLLIPKYAQKLLLNTVEAGLPGVRLEAASEYAAAAPSLQYACELTTTSTRPLAFDRAEAVSAAFLNSLHPLAPGQAIRVSWFVTGAGTPRPVRRSSARSSNVSWWLADSAPADADELAAQRTKNRDPQLLVTLRLGASAATVTEARRIVTRTAVTFRGANAPGTRVIRRLLPASLVIRAMARQALPTLSQSAVLLNTRELSTILGLPVGDVFVPGLVLGTARHLPPNPSAPRGALVLAQSTWPGSTAPLTMRTEDRLRHTWLLGPTGTGKSTLIAAMALQDAAAGRGFALVDPKSDLVEEILSRLPESRHSDVVLLDPTAAAQGQPIVGLDLLGSAHTEHDRERVVDNIVHIFAEVWRESFGPRTADVLRNSLLTLACTEAMDGSSFTLIEVAELLTNPVFRHFVTMQPSVPESVRGFWTAYESYSEPQKLQIIGPSLNKLRALSTRSVLRLMLGQSAGIDIQSLVNGGKILLVPLSKGTIGTDTAKLLGSLVVASLVNATFARAAIPAASRRPFFIYLDEFQDVLKLDLDIADLLSQARALGVGLVMANQYAGQLPDSIRRACFGTVRSTVLFQLDYDDAKIFERRFAPLTAADLQGRPAYEIAARLCDNNAIGRPVTGITLPLAEPTVDGSQLAQVGAARYGTSRTDVETAIRARTTPPSHSGQGPMPTTFGRRKRGGNP